MLYGSSKLVARPLGHKFAGESKTRESSGRKRNRIGSEATRFIPLDATLGDFMTFGQAVTSFFQNYVTFTGRAQRSAYWWVFLFNLIVAVIAAVLDQSLGMAYTMQGPAGPISLGYGP